MNKDHNGIFDGTSIIKAKLLWLIHVPFIVSLPSFFFVLVQDVFSKK